MNLHEQQKQRYCEMAKDDAHRVLVNENAILKSVIEKQNANLGEICIRNKELEDALKNIIKNWDEHLGVERGYPKEELKHSAIAGDYFSPSGAQIDSQYIASARKAIANNSK